MPYSVDVLQEGYVVSEGDGARVACTITLLRGKYNILVDTGSAWEKQSLIQALSSFGLSCEDIDYVVGTHGHSDHIGNLNLFTNSTHIVCHDINKGSLYLQHPFSENIPYAVDADVSIESTPGHTAQDIAVFVHASDSRLGLTAVCGDVFESEKDLDDPNLWRAQSQFPDIQEATRLSILKRVDTIVPGHGAMFHPPKSYKSSTSRV